MNHASGLLRGRREGLHTVLVAIGSLLAMVASGRADERLEYNRDIRPILFEACFACHGPDSAARKADLRLDKREAALDMGAIVPGKPDESELIRRILSDDPDERMPPPETKKNLSSAQKEKLTRWIAQGAEYQLHWSFIPPVRPPLPKIKHTSWARNPIDSFVAARLEQAGLAPAAEADRRILARRASLDLTGLPPDPALVEAFVSDESPDAYEKLLDKLLASKHWGEHRGRYWLDYARYADTHGIHFDNYREIWTYRDWVINAFNRNMTFDEFTIENLAGDLLPGATFEQRIGSGFNRCNMTTNEGGIIDEEYLVLYARDRTETTSQVWLGLTTGCAVCHDHKFDPVSQREFYELAAFFNNTTQAAKDGNIKDTPPILIVPREDELPRWNELKGLVSQASQQLDERRKSASADFEAWLTEAKPADVEAGVPSDDLHLLAALDQAEGTTTTLQIDGQPREVPLSESAKWQAGPTADEHALELTGGALEVADAGNFEADQPFSCAAWIKLPANDSHGAICARMDNAAGHRGWDFWVQQRRVGMHIINQWADTGLKVVARPQVKAGQWTHVAVTYDGSGKADGVKVFYNGKSVPTNIENDKLKGSIRTEVPLKVGQRNSGDLLSGASLNDLRLYGRWLQPTEIESLARLSRFTRIVAKPADKRTEAEKKDLFDWWLGNLDEAYKSRSRELTELEQEQNAIKGRGAIAYVMNEKDQAATAYILNRGEYDQRRDPVSADTPDVLPPFPSDAPRNRLGFAQWLLLPEHPLTARVTVNRFWQEVFGTGIVRTSGDFGVSGELPSHPELLDWLAVEFRESGWDVKKLFKLMLSSATYRQAATTTPEKLEKDPQNLLLSRGPRFRMDAEMVRDYALAASGLLVEKLGGPSVKPYQPPGVWEAIAMNVSNTRSYQPDSGENLYRRSMYTFWKRMAPPAAMDILNAPNRELCVVRRERTNTPLQALVTMNGEQFVEAARHLAGRALREGGDEFGGRLKVVSLRLLAREFTSAETEVVRGSYNDLLAYYREHGDDAKKLIEVGESPLDTSLDPAELAAWTMLVNELMNLDEVLNK
jgi:hypothetical protein